MNKKQKRAAREAAKAWGYKGKLKESGFYDIEGGVEGHLLKGATRVSLHSMANNSGLRKDRTVREFQDVADAEDPAFNFFEGGKARYMHHAALLSCQAIREGQLPDEECYVWVLHAQGCGERVISTLLSMPRSRIRKYLAHLRLNIGERLDID